MNQACSAFWDGNRDVQLAITSLFCPEDGLLARPGSLFWGEFSMARRRRKGDMCLWWLW